MDTALAGMVLAFLLTVVIGGFILLYPISRRAAVLLEQRIRERSEVGSGSGNGADGQSEALADSLRTLQAEVESLGEKQEFIERMLTERTEPRLPAGSPSPTDPD